jgi:hypothetical protein
LTLADAKAQENSSFRSRSADPLPLAKNLLWRN